MRRGDSTYRFFGANVWYLANLGAPKTGDKARLDRELDQLSRLGVTNVRLMAATEGPDELRKTPSSPITTCLGWCDERKGHCNTAKHASRCECEAARSKRPLGSAPARLLRLRSVGVVAPGSSTLPG